MKDISSSTSSSSETVVKLRGQSTDSLPQVRGAGGALVKPKALVNPKALLALGSPPAPGAPRQVLSLLSALSRQRVGNRRRQRTGTA